MKKEMIVSFVIVAFVSLLSGSSATAQNLDLSLWKVNAQNKETAGVAHDGGEIQVVYHIDNLTAGSTEGKLEVTCHLDRILDPGAVVVQSITGSGPPTLMLTPTPKASTGGPVVVQPPTIGVKTNTGTTVQRIGTVTPEIQPVTAHPSSSLNTARVFYVRVASDTSSLGGGIDPYDTLRSWKTFPAGLSPGKYRAVCVADSNDAYDEPDEDNNRAEVEFLVWRERDVDYTYTLSHIDETLGQTVDSGGAPTAGFAITIRNDGNQPSRYSHVECTVDGHLFQRRRHEPDMYEPGGESTHWFFSKVWKQSWEFRDGSLPVECELIVDGFGAVTGDQNLVETTFSETIIRGTPIVESADLSISDIRFSAHPEYWQNVHAGRNLWVMPKIRHNQQAILSGPIVVQCDLSANDTVIATAAAETSDIKPSGTEAGVGFGPQPAGTYEVSCTADVTSRVDDPNRQNNSRTAPLTIPG